MTDLDFSNVDQTIPRSLPLLDKLVDEYSAGAPLKDVTVLKIQHQLGNHFPQAKALLDLGVKPSDLVWVDVPYTSRHEVRQELINELGIPKQNFLIHNFNILDRYPPYQMRRIQEVFIRLLADPPDRLVVLDDGAYFIEAASCFTRQLPVVAVVEQTTRGLIKIEEISARNQFANTIPIINVARSTPKKSLEPPFIGRAVCDSLFRHLEPFLGSKPFLRCLILGFGAIGRQVAEFLPKKLAIDKPQVHVHDPDVNRQEDAQNAGFSVWDRDNHKKRFHIVIGCSGRKSFTLGDRVFLEDGAVLASASSGTVELSRQDFIELACVSEFDDISIEREGLDELDVHSNLPIKHVDRSVTFVNGGFPVIFDGRVNCTSLVDTFNLHQQ